MSERRRSTPALYARLRLRFAVTAFAGFLFGIFLFAAVILMFSIIGQSNTQQEIPAFQLIGEDARGYRVWLQSPVPNPTHPGATER